MTGRRARSPHSPRSPVISRGILAGSEERVFRVLPQSVLANMRHARHESALLWNTIYPRAQPRLSLRALLALRPLWGSTPQVQPDESLLPYYWGFAADGQRLGALEESLEAVAGRADLLEIDLLLVGQQTLIVVEAKHLASAGVCGRYSRLRCPEVHGPAESECHYWERPGEPFGRLFDFGVRPTAESDPPPCSRHYQLARTLLLARDLGARMGLIPHLWLILPRSRWKEVEPSWLDFAERVREDGDWRRLRVLSWESIARLRPA
ncbi:MAG TPA: hypothetical protein VFI11_04230 [Anaerolineales bacterium]|nr:hypothetical protein [Anaerolineales bacterium]